jgi:hypothetical protein
LLAILSLPAAAIGYVVTANFLSGLGLGAAAESFVLIFVPLFVAGLCMVPFVMPLFDRMAKRDLADLAAHRAQEAADAAGGIDGPSQSSEEKPQEGTKRP